mmetsp:Transcript_3497/g.6185  ORF Transcript_3497/g.6185 Transcript_3497/m.6185 type:complete len:236 (-) Transcript_3497:46-753(-)
MAPARAALPALALSALIISVLLNGLCKCLAPSFAVMGAMPAGMTAVPQTSSELPQDLGIGQLGGMKSRPETAPVSCGPQYQRGLNRKYIKRMRTNDPQCRTKTNRIYGGRENANTFPLGSGRERVENRFRNLDPGYTVGEEVYRWPYPRPQKNAGTIKKPSKAIGKCDKDYSECWRVCTRRDLSAFYHYRCQHTCYFERRTCYWKARPIFNKIHPAFHKYITQGVGKHKDGPDPS